MGMKGRKVLGIDLVLGAMTAGLIYRECPPVVVAAVKRPPTACFLPFPEYSILPEALLHYHLALLTHYRLQTPHVYL